MSLIIVTGRVSAQVVGAEPDPSDIVVTGSVYRGEVTSSSARIDADVRDLPLSISVVTKELIQDRQVRNLAELADNVAGVQSRQNSSGAFATEFTIRGLKSVAATTSLNGYRIGTTVGDAFLTGYDPQAVERVEFLKGPASVLYGGTGSLSGLVNIVTKTPRSDDFLILDATGGTRSYGRAGLDANVAMSDTLDGRFNAAFTHEAYPNAFRALDEQFANPVLRWHPTSNFTLLVEGSVFHSVQPTIGALSYPSTDRLLALPKTFKIAEKWDRDENTGYGGRLEANWAIASGLTLHVGANITGLHDDEVQQTNPTSPDLMAGPDLLNRIALLYPTRSRGITVQNELRWTFKTGAVSHKLLLGYEYAHERYTYSISDYINLPPLSLTDPVYGAEQPELPLSTYVADTSSSDGFYVQDFAEWSRFRLLVGGRFDRVYSSSAFCTYSTPGCEQHESAALTPASSHDTAFSPRAGLVWHARSNTMLYLSYSKSFNPNSFIDRDGKPLPPERGTQYEAGLRQDLLAPGRLTATLAVYRLTRSNIPRCDPLYPDCSRLISLGAQRIKGAEVEVSGKPLEWIDILATYSHLLGRVTKSDEAVSGIPVGSRLPEAGKNTASLFVKSDLTPLGKPAMAVSVGIYYLGPRPGREYFGSLYAGPFVTPFLTNPASTRVDLGAYWTLSPKVRIQVNITNVFDAKILEASNYGFARPTPLRATAGLRLSL